MSQQNKQAGKFWHVISGLSLITSTQIKNKCSALRQTEAPTVSAQLMFNRGSVWLGVEFARTKRMSSERSTNTPPLGASLKLMLCEGIAATARAKEILLPELHRWWGESKSFWGRWRDSFKNPHKPDEPGIAWIDAPCLSCIFTWWKGDRMNECMSTSPQMMYYTWSHVALSTKIRVAWGNLMSWKPDVF